MKLPRIPPGKTVTAKEYNELAERIEKLVRGLKGRGLTFTETPGGLVLNVISRPAIEVIIQDDEPAPCNWPQGWLWIDSDSATGNRRAVWIKTDNDNTSNKSKLRFPGIWLQDDEPNAADWAQGDLWVDTNSIPTTNYRQVWLKTEDDTATNVSKVAISVLVT